MATRATYVLPASQLNELSICFYVHYDGYPEGAAYKFWLMHHCKNIRGNFAGRFIRANDLAEFTWSADAHGDAEFSYRIDRKGTLQAFRKNFDNNQWELFYSGQWFEFVNEYLRIEEKENLYPFSEDKFSKRQMILTLSQAQVIVDETKAKSKEFYLVGAIGNAHSCELDALYLQQQIDNYKIQ